MNRAQPWLPGLMVCLNLFAGDGASSRGAESVELSGLGANVEVHFDGHGIPHIFARSWPDAARALGYLHASDRLGQMDLFRRMAFGTTAEILGQESLDSDILARRLGIRRNCEILWNSGDLPEALRLEMTAYADGINARIASLGDKNLPPTFHALGYKPAPWTPVDTLAFSKYMGWDQSGTTDDLWFGLMVEKLGVTAVEELWPLDRPYEIPTVKVKADRKRVARAALDPVRGCGPAYQAALRAFAHVRWLGRGGSFGSNNWAVDGSRTASGKPILCSDPHLGFNLPSIWYAVHISVNGENMVGVTMPGGPTIVIGHNDELGWGLTNLQADAVDYFVETLHAEDPMRYRHRGEWKPIERRTEQIAVKGQAPHQLHVDSTVHGPIISREGRTISMQWTGLRPTKELAAFWQMSHAKNLKQFLKALDDLTVPAMNVVYADAAGNVAIHPCGALPLRTRGQGRIPMDGASGDHDWTGLIPRSELPLAVNPPDHFVASANGRPAGLDYPHYLGWMWDPSYRIRRINDLLKDARGLTVESMKPIQCDAYDKAAERFVPILLGDLKAEALTDPLARQARAELEKWDFVAGTEAIAPIIWVSWFKIFRDQVWLDEWAARGLEQPAGSWGFNGTNRREPMLEVLEYITREHPQSIWFDDRATLARESRGDIMRRSFSEAVRSLKKEFGDDLEQWRWGRINQLKVGSITRQPELARAGGPTVGTAYTVNPGSNGGPVGSGASWRMIVDFGHLDKSVGIYPGGQSEDPQSPFYNDQMGLWANGQYLPLNMASDAKRLPAQAKARSITFKRP